MVYVGTAADVDNRQRYVQIDGSNMIMLVDTHDRETFGNIARRVVGREDALVVRKHEL